MLRKKTGANAIKISAPNADLHYYPEFIPMAQRFYYFEQLMNEVPWQQDSLKMYGKLVAIPRLQAWFGDANMPYTYSGLTMQPLAWTPSLLAIKSLLENKLNQSFNSALVNLYRDGQDTVGWHSDDEPELGNSPTIASVSLGATRKFQLKHKQLDKKLALELTAGSLLVMAGYMQTYWQHCLPRTKRVQSPRINITFRNIFV